LSYAICIVIDSSGVVSKLERENRDDLVEYRSIEVKYVMSLIVGVMIGLLIEAGGVVIAPLLITVVLLVMEVVKNGFSWLCIPLVVGPILVVADTIHPMVGIAVIVVSIIVFIHSVEAS